MACIAFPAEISPKSFIEFFNEGLSFACHYASLPEEYRQISEKFGKVFGGVFGAKFEQIHKEIIVLDSLSIERAIENIELPDTFNMYDILVCSDKLSFDLVATSRKQLEDGTEFGARLYSFKDDDTQLNFVVPFYKGIINHKFAEADSYCKETLLQAIHYKGDEGKDAFTQALFQNLCTKTATEKEFLDIKEALQFMERLNEFWGIEQV